MSSTIARMARFGRVLSAMVTPFDNDGGLDLEAARVLARYLQEHGNDALVLAGTTGEAPTLNDDERLSLFAAVLEVVTIPVIAGTGTNDTRHSIHLTKEAKALGAAATGLLLERIGATSTILTSAGVLAVLAHLGS